MMKRSMRIMTGCIIVLVMILAAGCASGGSVQQTGTTAAAANPWLGLWEAVEKDGTIYSVEFTSATEWEAHLENSGLRFPFFKGTYTSNGARAELQILQEGNLDTGAWVTPKDKYPSMTARLANNKFNLPIFTNQDFSKD